MNSRRAWSLRFADVDSLKTAESKARCCGTPTSMRPETGGGLEGRRAPRLELERDLQSISPWLPSSFRTDISRKSSSAGKTSGKKSAASQET